MHWAFVLFSQALGQGSTLPALKAPPPLTRQVSELTSRVEHLRAEREKLLKLLVGACARVEDLLAASPLRSPA